MSTQPDTHTPERGWTHRPLHQRLNMGAEMGQQTNQNTVIQIVESYLAQMKAGQMTVERIGEIDLGGGKYIRTFVIQE